MGIRARLPASIALAVLLPTLGCATAFGSGYVWVPGHWRYGNDGDVWVDGFWTYGQPPAGYNGAYYYWQPSIGWSWGTWAGNYWGAWNPFGYYGYSGTYGGSRYRAAPQRYRDYRAAPSRRRRSPSVRRIRPAPRGYPRRSPAFRHFSAPRHGGGGRHFHSGRGRR